MKIIVRKEIKVEKCDKCDKYGHILKYNIENDLNSGTYMPYCDCEFGQWLYKHSETGDMFFSNRQIL